MFSSTLFLQVSCFIGVFCHANILYVSHINSYVGAFVGALHDAVILYVSQIVL